MCVCALRMCKKILRARKPQFSNGWGGLEIGRGDWFTQERKVCVCSSGTVDEIVMRCTHTDNNIIINPTSLFYFQRAVI